MVSLRLTPMCCNTLIMIYNAFTYSTYTLQMSALQCSLGISEKESKPVTINARAGHGKSNLLCVPLYLRGWLFVCLYACLFVCQCHDRKHASAQEQGPSNAIVCQSHPWSPLVMVRPQRRPFIEYWISQACQTQGHFGQMSVCCKWNGLHSDKDMYHHWIIQI